MSEHEERAFQYRQRAEELRAILPDMTDKVTRETIEKIAAGYDQLASVQDNLAKADNANEKPSIQTVTERGHKFD